MTAGRPPSLTTAKLDEFRKHHENLDNIDDVARLMNVHPATCRRWIREGKDASPRTLVARFRSIALSARLAQKSELLGIVITIARTGDTEAVRLNAAKYLLDRVHRLAVQVEHSGSIHNGAGAPPEAGGLDFRKLTPDQLGNLHGILAAATVADDDRDDDQEPDT